MLVHIHSMHRRADESSRLLSPRSCGDYTTVYCWPRQRSPRNVKSSILNNQNVSRPHGKHTANGRSDCFHLSCSLGSNAPKCTELRNRDGVRDISFRFAKSDSVLNYLSRYLSKHLAKNRSLYTCYVGAGVVGAITNDSQQQLLLLLLVIPLHRMPPRMEDSSM